MRPNASGEGRKVRRVHADCIDEQRAPPVPITPDTGHLRHLVQPVHRPVPQESQRLQNNGHALELPTTSQMHGVLCEPLHGVLDVFELSIDNHQKRHITDAEAAVLDDAHLAAVLAGMYGPILPRITEIGQLVHRLEHVEHEFSRSGHRSLMHEPARHARTGEILPPRQKVHLVGGMLRASPGIFHCKGAVAQDGYVVAFQLFVRTVVVHAVCNVATELVFTRVIDNSIPGHAAGVVEEA
mmetsp:Transcript_18891/g.44840  ORF Transcript_18891/g.44840 Transcript_18891/m.44840 type:complete len:240 (-) Transcript_18891:818-1537(-)